MADEGDKAGQDTPDDRPLSLYGMSPEDALRKALSTPPPRKDTQSGDESAKS